MDVKPDQDEPVAHEAAEASSRTGDEAKDGRDAGAESAADERSSERSGEAPPEGEPWDPWGALSNLHETVGGIVDSALRSVSPAPGRFPRYDLVRLSGGEGYRVSFDLPGLDKAAVDVTVSGRELSVAGERRRPELPDGARVERSERTYGRFRRTLDLPPGVDPDRIAARMENGVLELHLPLRGVNSTAQKIEVE